MASSDSSIDKEQGFLSHLVELRDRLLKMLLAVGILFLSLFWFSDKIYTALAAPLLRHLPDSQMIAIDVAAPFFIPFKLTLMLCVFLAVPYLLYQIWSFVAPGLYSHEKRLVVPLLVSSTVLFYAGVAFAYFVVFPLVFGFFTSVAPEGVTVSTDIGRYLDFVITLFFAFGIAFEVPVATVLVVAVGITTPEQLVKIRPYVFVAAFIIGMFLTPPDMISQTLLAVPMWLLYEVGIVFSRKFKDRITAAGLARDKRYDEDDDSEPFNDDPGPDDSGPGGGSDGGNNGQHNSGNDGGHDDRQNYWDADSEREDDDYDNRYWDDDCQRDDDTDPDDSGPAGGSVKGAPRTDSHDPEYTPPRPASATTTTTGVPKGAASDAAESKSVAADETSDAADETSDAAEDSTSDSTGDTTSNARLGQVDPALIQKPDANGAYRNSLTDSDDDESPLNKPDTDPDKTG